MEFPRPERKLLSLLIKEVTSNYMLIFVCQELCGKLKVKII
jgi:hypothetical protein